MYVTRKIKIGTSSQLDALAQASGRLWSCIAASFWRVARKKGVYLSKYGMQRWKVNGYESLHSHSAQAVNDQFYNALKSWRFQRKAKAQVRPPHKQKRFNKIVWKSAAITVRDGKLRLSNGRGNDPLWIKWQWPEPKTVEVGWDGEQYELRAKYKIQPIASASADGVAGIDLGEIHLAVAYDGKETIIINGRHLRSLRQYQNKTKAKLSALIDRKKRGSRRWKRLVTSKNKQLAALRNQIRDVLHKLSTRLVDALHERGVSTLVIGDVRHLRDGLDYGSKVNQKLHQWAYARFAHMIQYKAQLRGMKVERINEAYTSQTCPECRKRNKVAGRRYRCAGCGFEYHRDGVGSINIRAKYLGCDPVVGDMAPPTGIRYKPNMRCSSLSVAPALAARGR